jgi:protein-tyrosine phosphatase
MWTKLYWVDGPWPGKLALAARPRGGEWLADEISGWKSAGITHVLSLLTPEEEKDLDLRKEAAEVSAQGMKFLSFPIPDRQVPNSESELAAVLGNMDAFLSSGNKAVVHCRQGIGRTGLVAACLLVAKGVRPESARAQLSAARGVAVPETPEQSKWIDHYSAAFVGAK